MADKKTIIVKHGGAIARIRQRGDGLWVVRWREAGKGRNTTLVTKERAEERARQIVRKLSGSQGGQIVTVDDAQIVGRVKALAGERSPFIFLGEIEGALKELKGVPLSRAINHWRASGMGDVERVTMKTARNRFLDDYEKRSVWTRAGVRKEIDAFVTAHSADLCVCDLTTAMLSSWIQRPKLDGARIGARFHNNRLSTWMTFFNKAREWKMWPRGEKHPAELLTKQTEPRGAVPIWTPDEAHGILAACQAESPRQVPYVIIGCWLGLRPTEATRVEWRHFDWKRGYLHLDHEVARKLQEERYVPLNAKARGLLETWSKEHGAGSVEKEQGKCCLIHDREMVSVLARRKKIIKTWHQDVMRHSYISYSIALGKSKHEVAEWSGNSENTIRRKYRRPLIREDGEAWFTPVER